MKSAINKSLAHTSESYYDLWCTRLMSPVHSGVVRSTPNSERRMIQWSNLRSNILCRCALLSIWSCSSGKWRENSSIMGRQLETEIPLWQQTFAGFILRLKWPFISCSFHTFPWGCHSSSLAPTYDGQSAEKIKNINHFFLSVFKIFLFPNFFLCFLCQCQPMECFKR